MTSKSELDNDKQTRVLVAEEKMARALDIFVKLETPAKHICLDGSAIEYSKPRISKMRLADFEEMWSLVSECWTELWLHRREQDEAFQELVRQKGSKEAVYNDKELKLVE